MEGSAFDLDIDFDHISLFGNSSFEIGQYVKTATILKRFSYYTSLYSFKNTQKK